MRGSLASSGKPSLDKEASGLKMNEINPKVTVWMSAYNHERYVEAAILAIVNQTYQDFELLVLDDGSSDRTADILAQLSKKHGFHFERQENRGLTRSFNKLAKQSRGEYVTLCASDDTWPLDRLEQQVLALSADSSIDLVHGNARSIDENGKVSASKILELRPLGGPKAFRDYILKRGGFLIGTVMFRRQSFFDIGGFREDLLVEDLNFMLRSFRLLNVEYVEELWLNYRRHANNFSKSPEGARKLLGAHLFEVKTLPFPWGLIYFYIRIPAFIQLMTVARSKNRFIWAACALPFNFFRLSFLKAVLFCFIGPARYERIRRSLRSASLS